MLCGNLPLISQKRKNSSRTWQADRGSARKALQCHLFSPQALFNGIALAMSCNNCPLLPRKPHFDMLSIPGGLPHWAFGWELTVCQNNLSS
eukprot:4533998-Amphidinium_carterae.1